jgi:hypothetical protein
MKPTPENGPRDAESVPPQESAETGRENGAMTKQLAELLVAKYNRWESVFRKIKVIDQVADRIAAGAFDEERVFNVIDEFVAALEQHPEISLKEYSLFVHPGRTDELLTHANTISLSILDLMKDGGPAATAERIVEKIHERTNVQSKYGEAASENERGTGVVGSESKPEVVTEKEGAVVAGSESAPRASEQSDIPTGPKSVADGEIPPGTFDDRIPEESNDEHWRENISPERPEGDARLGGTAEPEPMNPAIGTPKSAEQHIDPSTFRFRSLEDRYGESGSQWKRRVMDTASRLKENFYVKNVVDWAKIAYNSALDDWHTGFAVARKVDLNERLAAIRNLEEGYRHLTTEQDRFRREGGVSEKVLMDVEKDRAEQERKIEQKKKEADKIQSKLEYRNNQRARYENARAAASEHFMTRVQEKLGPFEEKLFELKKTREQLASEISHHRSLIKDYQDRMDLLQKKIDQEQFPSLRRSYWEAMKEIQRIDRDIMSEVAAREKDMRKIDKRIVRYDHKANPWRDKYNELARITKRKGPDTSVVRRTIFEESSSEIHTVEGHPRADADRNGTIVSDGGIVPAETGLLDPELLEEYSPEDFVKAWNSMNGSRMTINPATAKKNFPNFFDEENISVDDGWRFAEFYAERFGDEDRHEGMPSMEGSARKRRRIGFWARLFGRSGRAKGRRRLLEFLDKK